MPSYKDLPMYLPVSVLQFQRFSIFSISQSHVSCELVKTSREVMSEKTTGTSGYDSHFRAGIRVKPDPQTLTGRDFNKHTN